MNSKEIKMNKFEILRKNILAASVFSMAYEILKKHTVIKRIEHFFSDIHKCKKDGYEYKKNTDEYKKHVLSLDKKERPLQASLEWLKQMNAINDEDLKSFKGIKDCRNFLVHETFHFISESMSEFDINKKFEDMVNLLRKIDRWWIVTMEDHDDLDQSQIKPGSVILFQILLDAAIGPEDILKKYYNLLPMEDITMKMHWKQFT